MAIERALFYAETKLDTALLASHPEEFDSRQEQELVFEDADINQQEKDDPYAKVYYVSQPERHTITPL